MTRFPAPLRSDPTLRSRRTLSLRDLERERDALRAELARVKPSETPVAPPKSPQPARP
jgi:hypothetical protein